ncbi:putative membrane protein [Diplonema papillatum]|nr:putative membrane protein [Diplonema papillatum]
MSGAMLTLSQLGIDREIVGGVYLTMASGVPAFAFSSYSETIRNRHGYSPTEMNTIGSAFQIGICTAVLGGLLLDKYGPRETSLVAFVLGVGGYLGLYALTETHGSVPVAYYLVAAYCVGQAGAFCYLTAFKICQPQVDPRVRGRLVAVLSSWIPLSAGIFTVLERALFTGTDIFLVLAGMMAIQAGIGASMRPEVWDKDANAADTLERLYGVTAGGIFFVFLAGVISDHWALFGSLMLAVLASPAVVLFFCLFAGERLRAASASLFFAAERASTRTCCSAVVEGSVFFASYFLVLGPAAALANTFAGLVISRSDVVVGETYVRSGDAANLPSRDFVAAVVITFAASNTVGRLVAGVLADKLRERASRTFWYPVWGAFSAAGFVLLAVYTAAVPELLAVGLLGFGVGGVQIAVPQLVSDISGANRFGFALAFASVAPAAGSFVFGVVSGAFEERYMDDSFVFVKEKNDTDAVKYCASSECFEGTLFVSAGSVLLGSAIGVAMWRHWCTTEDLDYVDIDNAESSTDVESSVDRFGSFAALIPHRNIPSLDCPPINAPGEPERRALDYS